jgi:hypothetical protein
MKLSQNDDSPVDKSVSKPIITGGKVVYKNKY